jgi:hypothetical protein
MTPPLNDGCPKIISNSRSGDKLEAGGRESPHCSHVQRRPSDVSMLRKITHNLGFEKLKKEIPSAAEDALQYCLIDNRYINRSNDLQHAGAPPRRSPPSLLGSI